MTGTDDAEMANDVRELVLAFNALLTTTGDKSSAFSSRNAIESTLTLRVTMIQGHTSPKPVAQRRRAVSLSHDRAPAADTTLVLYSRALSSEVRCVYLQHRRGLGRGARAWEE